MRKKRQKIIIGVGIILVVLGIIIGASYALWITTPYQESVNKIASDCLKIKLTGKNEIQLEKAYPIRDSEVKELVPYEFTIENTCNLEIKYQVNLEIMDGNRISSELIGVSINNGGKKLLNTYEEVEPTYSKSDYQAVESRNLVKGKRLKGKERITYALKLWLDQSVTLEDDVINKEFIAKVSVVGEITPELDTMVARAGSTSTEQFWAHSETITKVIFQNELKEIPNAIETYDLGTTNPEAIKGYLVVNEDGETHTLYLQGKNGIEANANSNHLFFNFTQLTEIENLEYLDTSQVTNMSHMFASCNNLTELNLSNFDTRNVIDMSSMFYQCENLINLDLSHFNTTNVANMRTMFAHCNNLAELNLSNFDTSQVTSMSSMFYYCKKLNSLDISNFDTRNVIDMSSMFYQCENLINLDLSHFNTTNVTNMQAMFAYCRNLTTLDLRGFDTSQVNNMASMFYYCNKLNSLDVSSFDTRNVTTMASMFWFCSSFTTLDLRNFDTSQVTDMGGMFGANYNLTYLDISNFDTRNVTKFYTGVYGMFGGNSKLETIVYGENFIKKDGADTTKMFTNCPASKPTHESWNGVF